MDEVLIYTRASRHLMLDMKHEGVFIANQDEHLPAIMRGTNVQCVLLKGRYF